MYIIDENCYRAIYYIIIKNILLWKIQQHKRQITIKNWT